MEYCLARRISGTWAEACDSNQAAPPRRRKHAKVRSIAWSFFPCGVCFYFYRQQSRLRGGLDFSNAAIPVENLLAVPVQHALVLVHVVVNLLEIFDPVRLAADVRMDRQRAELRARLALGIKPVELVDGALEQIVALVMLDQHHRNVVELDGVGQRD